MYPDSIPIGEPILAIFLACTLFILGLTIFGVHPALAFLIIFLGLNLVLALTAFYYYLERKKKLKRANRSSSCPRRIFRYPTTPPPNGRARFPF